MAKITGPLFSMEARGKFGDVVFMQRGGKSIARKRTVPANPRSALQQAVRLNLGSLSKIYLARGLAADTYGVRRIDRSGAAPAFADLQVAQLTAAEKASWDDMQEFTGVNARRLSDNLAPIRTKAA